MGKDDNNLVQEKGVALIVALFFLLILSLLGLSLLLNAEMENATSGNYSKTVKATYAAQAGLERIKPYLLYDYAQDPEGWANEYLVVPFGTAGSSDATAIGLPGEGYFDLSQGGTITVPSDTPYDVVNSLADAQNPALFAAATSPTYSPEAGYEIMFRNIPPGVHAADQICVQAIGSTGKVKSLGGIGTRGSNILEACYTADILSIWDNIIFSADASGLSGGGEMHLHGNIHVLGNEANPGDVVYDSKAEHYNCYDCGNPTLDAVPFDNLLNATEANRTTLNAKFRIKNGVADLDTGAACVGSCEGPAYEGAYVCTSCPTSPYEGFSSQASEDAVVADEEGEYDIPADVQSIIDFPEVTDPHVDQVTGIGYDNYSDYLIGDEDTSPFQPGALGLKLRLAFTNPGTTYNLGNSTSLAAEVWNQKDSIFLFNVNTNTPGVNRAQVALDPVGMDSNPDEGDPIFTPTIGVDSTFMVIAADLAQGVVLVYKETQSFTRSGVTHPRQVHGFVFAPSSADMTNLALDVDLDGSDLDTGDGTENYAPATLDPTASNNLVRKVVNALWLSSQKSCGTPCYTSASAGNFHATIQSTQISHDDTDTGRLDVGNLGNFFVAYGVIQTTDHYNIAADGVTYMGRVTMFIDEPDANPGTGAICDFSCAELAGNVRPITSYQSGGQWYAFPCQNNMGVLASDDIDFEKQPHTDKVGAFYASDTTYVEKQFQILGAMVSDIWDFSSGGNPDMFQAMEMARCLPPYMIGDETVPVLGTTRFVER